MLGEFRLGVGVVLKRVFRGFLFYTLTSILKMEGGCAGLYYIHDVSSSLLLAVAFAHVRLVGIPIGG